MRVTAIKDKLRALMDERGESNYALAKALGVSNSTVANWLGGESTPIRVYQKMLADHYGTTVEALNQEEDP